MTDYTKAVNFAAKDDLPSGDTNKIIRGTEINTEFNNIAAAIATKANTASPALTGTISLNGTPITATATELNVLDGITATTTELNYTDGVTSAIQTQINTKAPIASPTFTGTATAANLTATGTVTFDGVSFANGAPSNSLVVNAAGKVGIGTAPSDAALQVYVADTTIQARVGDTVAGTSPIIRIQGKNAADTINSFADIKLNAETNVFSLMAPNNVGPDIDALNIAGDGSISIDGTTSVGTGVTDLALNAVSLAVSGVNGRGGQLTTATGSTGRTQQDFKINAPDTAAEMIFETTSIERMRIDSSGNVLVGTTNTVPGQADVTGIALKASGFLEASVSGVPAALFNRGASDGQLVSFRRSGSGVGNISVTTTATAYNTSSDYRLKENVIPMTGAADRVLALKPSRFNFIADPTKVVDGFLAHEAQSVVPESVTGTKDAMTTEEYAVSPAVYETVVTPAEYDEDGVEITPESTEEVLVTAAVMGEREVPDYQAIDQSKLVPLLTAALQEALLKIDTLTARIEALEAL